MAIDFTQAYETDPWARLDKNQRDWYVPELLAPFKADSLFRPLVPMQTDYSLRARQTQKMIFNLVFDYEPNINPIGMRQLWLDSMQTDSAQLEITTEHHAGKVVLHKLDEYITYWQENGRPGLANIVRRRLAPSMTWHLDRLARNAFLTGYFQRFAGTATKWSELTASDVFSTDWAMEAQLKAMTLELPGFDGVRGSGSILAITTPGSIFQVKQTAAWTDRHKYTETGLALLNRMEIGSHNGTRYIPGNPMVLWNAGPITHQAAIRAPVNAGDGGSSWAKYLVGQGGAVQSIQVTDFTNEFRVGDRVTIHVSRADASGVITLADGSSFDKSGVAYGVNPFDGLTFERDITAVDNTVGAATLSFDRPLFWDYTTDYAATDASYRDGITHGGGAYAGAVYGYVTKGINVHSTLFMFLPGGVVAGVTQAPEMHTPPTIDDTMSMRRFSWDAYIRYQEFRSELHEVWFHAGPHRAKAGVQYGDEVG